MKKKFLRVLLPGMLFTLCICLFSGCGNASSKGQDNTAASADTGGGYYAADVAAAEEIGYETEETASYSDSSASEGSGAAAEILDENMDTSERKLIRNMNLSLETTDFDNLTANIEKQAEALGGYLEESSLYSNSYDGLRSAYIRARIPADSLDTFEESVTGSATVLNRSVSVTDVTLSYSDLESHIASLKIEQETLNELLKEAKDIDTVLAIQTQLTDIRYELESYASQLKIMANQVTYSTVYIDINEVEIPSATDNDSFTSRVSRTFKTSTANLAEGFIDFLVWFLGNIVSILIFIAVIAVLLIAVRFLPRRTRAGKKKKEAETDKAMQNSIDAEQNTTESDCDK